MGHFGGFLGSVLPDVWPKNLPTRSKYNMSSSMMRHKLLSPILINLHINFLSHEHLDISFKWSVKDMENTLTNLDGIDDLVSAGASLDLELGVVMLLSSGGWVNCRSVKDDDVWLVLLENVVEDSNYGGVELHEFVLLVVEVIGLFQVRGVIEDDFGLLGSSLLSQSDFIIQV